MWRGNGAVEIKWKARGRLEKGFCRHLCQHHVPLAATAAIVSVVCQANDHGFEGIRIPKQKRNTGFKMFDLDDFVKMFDDIMVNCCKDDFKKC
ncbi:hypothetical protein Tco_0090164 [Tanacetum coccineum]